MSEYRGVLRAGEQLPAGVPYLASEPEHLYWGELPIGGDGARIRLSSGDSVVVDTLSHEGLLEDQGRDPRAWFGSHGVDADFVLEEAVGLAGSRDERDPSRHGPHVVSGPIDVADTRPGDLLRITVLDTTPRVPYGVISNRHGRGALPGEFPLAPGNVSVFTPIARDERGVWTGRLPLVEGGDRDVRFPLAPFLGIMGVASDTDTRPHSVPPGPHGGNIDLNLLVEGASLYLPVQVKGAGAYVGDPHFAQGGGEVALTALEASLRVTLEITAIPAETALRDFGKLVAPVAETAEHLVPMGLDADLDEAMRECVRAAVALLGSRYGMAPQLALAYLSAATDFEVTQVVDLVSGVHARIRTSDFARVRRR